MSKTKKLGKCGREITLQCDEDEVRTVGGCL